MHHILETMTSSWVSVRRNTGHPCGHALTFIEDSQECLGSCDLTLRSKARSKSWFCDIVFLFVLSGQFLPYPLDLAYLNGWFAHDLMLFASIQFELYII